MHLSNIYSLIALMIIIVILMFITLLNAVYFSDVYNDGSENLSSSQSQQLIVLNTIASFLLFIVFIMILYIYINKSDKFNEIMTLEKILNKKKEQFDDNIQKAYLLNQNKTDLFLSDSESDANKKVTPTNKKNSISEDSVISSEDEDDIEDKNSYKPYNRNKN